MDRVCGCAVALCLTGCAGGRGTAAGPCGGPSCVDEPSCPVANCESVSAPPPRPNPVRRHPATVVSGAVPRCHHAPELSDATRAVAHFDDAKIPEYDRARDRYSNDRTGSDRLQDHEIHEHLLLVHDRLFACLDIAACFQEEAIGDGELHFRFELEPDGRVSAVSVDPSTDLDHPVIRACARRSIYDFRFPSYRGARMVVSYRVEIGEAI